MTEPEEKPELSNLPGDTHDSGIHEPIKKANFFDSLNKRVMAKYVGGAVVLGGFLLVGGYYLNGCRKAHERSLVDTAVNSAVSSAVASAVADANKKSDERYNLAVSSYTKNFDLMVSSYTKTLSDLEERLKKKPKIAYVNDFSMCNPKIKDAVNFENVDDDLFSFYTSTEALKSKVKLEKNSEHVWRCASRNWLGEALPGILTKEEWKDKDAKLYRQRKMNVSYDGRINRLSKNFDNYSVGLPMTDEQDVKFRAYFKK